MDACRIHTHARRHRFLVVEDEQDLAELVALHLQDLNADVTTTGNGLTGLELALNQSWDAVLLDLQLPGMDGLDICRSLRNQLQHLPIVMLTSRSTELDRVLGLEIGADDYLTKPFSVAELKARIKALLRRCQQPALATAAAPSQICYGELHLDHARRRTTLEGITLELTAREFDLLWFFVRHPGRVFSRQELLDKVWGYGHEGYEHTVNSHINRLRAKLESDPAHPRFIETVWGVGYRFSEAGAQSIPESTP